MSGRTVLCLQYLIEWYSNRMLSDCKDVLSVVKSFCLRNAWAEEEKVKSRMYDLKTGETSYISYHHERPGEGEKAKK